jgi:hypothetical protein
MVGVCVGRRKARGYEFRWYAADHPPPHVHIFDEKGREIGRFDVVGQRPMDPFPLTRKLRKALEEAGFMRSGED